MSDSATENETICGDDRFRSILQNINEYVYSVDYADGKPIHTYHSPRCLDVTGYTSDELEQNVDLWHSMIHPEDQKQVADFLARVGVSSDRSSIEHRIIEKSGSVRWVSNNCSVLRSDKGEIIRLDGFIQDITEKVKNLDELQKLSVAVEQSPASVVVTDLNGLIEYVNPKFTQLTGYSLDEVIGKNTSILKSGEMSAENYRRLWERILSGKEWRGEFHNKKKNGDLYWELASISPVFNPQKQITHFIAVKEDITVRKQAEQALRESEESLRIRNELMEEDLRYAQRVQLALLPKEPPVSKSIRVAYRYLPLEMVGGDYFSFFEHGDRLGVFVGDVSGHGVPAALYLSLLKLATDNVVREGFVPPHLFLERLNGVLCGLMSNYFLAALYAEFHREGDVAHLTIASGGHPPAVIVRQNGEAFTLRGKGGILGVNTDVKFFSQSVDLKKGDRAFIYTDGIPEARNSKDIMIGYDETVLLVSNSAKDGIDFTLDAIFDSVRAFAEGTPFDDDIVLIGCEVK